MDKRIGLTLSFILLVIAPSSSGCSPALTIAPSPAATSTREIPTETLQVTSPTTQESEKKATSSPTPQNTPTSTPDLRLKPENWRNWPVIPEISPQMVAVYQKGLVLGRDPHVFSLIGDCQSSPTYFLSKYDEGRYVLPPGQEHLQETIDWYSGSFSHRSIAVKNGMTAPGALNPRWADPEKCDPQETPVECEIHLSNPSVMLISLGTNWHPSTSHEKYLDYLKQIVEILFDKGVVPILSTKADNAEGDYSRNLAMAQIAYEYHLPLWNFWAAVADLSNQGLDKDRESVYLNHEGWAVRNESALKLLDSLRRQLNQAQD